MHIEIIGWTGTILVLLAYFLVSSGKIKGISKVFQLLNLFSAIFLGINATAHGAWPVLGLNIAWATIALVALFRFKTKTA